VGFHFLFHDFKRRFLEKLLERRALYRGNWVYCESLTEFVIFAIENQRFNQMEKILRQITPQNKLYYFSEKKKIGGLGAL